MNEYMKIAFKEAKKAFKKKEIPVGAVIVKNGKIIAKSKNNRQKKHNLLGHAEINCILKAEKKLKDWRLDECDMYITLAPCEMCEIHLKEVRLKNVYYLIHQNGKKPKNINIIQTNDCNDLKKDYKNLLDMFFKKLRK